MKRRDKFKLWFHKEYRCYVLRGSRKFEGIVYEISSFLENRSQKKVVKKRILRKLDRDVPNNTDSWAHIIDSKNEYKMDII